MDKDENTGQVRKWKAIAIALAVVAAVSIGLPYLHSSSENSTDEPIILNNGTHGVKKIATVDIEPGKISPVKKST